MRSDDPYGWDMLTVTEAAAQAINSLVAQNKMPEGSGLRIAPQGESTRSEGLGLSIAKAPAEDDTVLEAHGAKIFLAATVVHALNEQELDTEPDAGGGSGFIVNRKPGAKPEGPRRTPQGMNPDWRG